MENVAIVLFDVESEGYQAFTRLEQAPVADGYAVTQFDLVKREGDALVPCNRGDSGLNTTDDAWKGGLIGTFVGILGGPLGILLGGAAGATLGMAFDADDAVANQSLTEMAATKLYDGEVALIALVQEDAEEPFNALFGGLSCTIIRRDAAEVAQEVDEARAAEAELSRQARAATAKPWPRSRAWATWTCGTRTSISTGSRPSSRRRWARRSTRRPRRYSARRRARAARGR